MIRALLIALLVPTLVWAQPSQPPTPDQKPAETTQPKPEPDLRGTAQMPLAVEIVPTQVDKEKERREWLRENAKEHEEHELVAATWDLVKWTGILAAFTAALFFATAYTAIKAEKSAAKALKASTQATDTFLKLERPYVTAGGYSDAISMFVGTPRVFHLQVHNMGKTPAFMTDYDIRFAYLKDVRGTDVPAQLVEPRFPFDDRFGADQMKTDVDVVPVEPSDADIVYGAVWYQDWAKQEHCFRFVLRIDPHVSTRPDISKLVHPDYSKWD
ncbi:hypothetical protein SAMN02990966_07124 [Rhodospirillales bacterium URHD0017]|nr:hypothetical protein SAMN02990966_07124 [Rhodospirillales bacterium URHD0017]